MKNTGFTKLSRVEKEELEVEFGEDEVWNAIKVCGTERVKKVIGKLIGEEQNAFIKGRFILDGVLIGNEVVQFLKKKKEKAFLLKIDFEKAYDSINWSFIRNSMIQMGFGDRWCNWIEACFKSSRISVLVNGSPTGEFSMERGIRQGDPLSPFLYLIAAEGLNVTLKEAVSKGIYKGVQIGRERRASISHLQYADDTLVFGEWNSVNAKNLMRILECVQQASGLKINNNKSKLYGIGVSNQEVVWMANRMGCLSGRMPFMYLGIPIGLNMKNIDSWNGIVEKFKTKLSHWKARSMSCGGRLTLVKSVLGSLSLYYFSMFRVPVGVLKKLESIRQKIFWGSTDEIRKVAWVKWDRALNKKSFRWFKYWESKSVKLGFVRKVVVEVSG
ncbi:reverse transcriptase domain, reverse transcriptase zinc-binding domain protein [Tanacetum coccineum]